MSRTKDILQKSQTGVIIAREADDGIALRQDGFADSGGTPAASFPRSAPLQRVASAQAGPWSEIQIHRR